MKNTIRIGFGADHGEICHPENPEFSIFFSIFIRLPVSLSRVNYTKEELDTIDALLIGCPLHQLPREEIICIHNWVERGGMLLLLSTMGGDSAVGCEYRYQSNLSLLAKGVEFSDTAVGRFVGRNYQHQFLTQCLVDTSHVIPHHPRITYVDGCALIWNGTPKDLVVRCSLPLQTQALHEFRIGARNTYARPESQEGDALLCIKRGMGRVVCFGAVESISRKGLTLNGNVGFLFYLLTLWLPTLIHAELHRRMQQPQRHRLLHAYPMAPLMFHSKTSVRSRDIEQTARNRSAERHLLLGVLPHPYCNPMVKGCGFCTFPHEQFSRTSAVSVAKMVRKEIQQRVVSVPSLRTSPVDAIYFGGATANLTPFDDFSPLLCTLYELFSCDDAEVTLEGAPIYFLRGDGPKLLQLIANTATRGRISMGVQTFDPQRLKQMGRQGYGTKESIQELVREAHRQGLQTSCDLLIDLPYQSFEEIVDDIHTAIDMGFDQICIYHLVLYKDLGTEWAKDPHMLQGLPSNEESSLRWKRICALMHQKLFRQTTLTNFERLDVIEAGKNFRYEAMEMNLLGHDFIGFGPAGITRVAHTGLLSGYKMLNPSSSEEYLHKMEHCQNGLPVEASFSYDARDMQILSLTRHMGRARIDKDSFTRLYGLGVEEAFPSIFPVFFEKGFLEEDGQLTPLGNSYADSMAGLLAWPKIIERELTDKLEGYVPPSEEVYYNTSRRHWMG